MPFATAYAVASASCSLACWEAIGLLCAYLFSDSRHCAVCNYDFADPSAFLLAIYCTATATTFGFCLSGLLFRVNLGGLQPLGIDTVLNSCWSAVCG